MERHVFKAISDRARRLLDGQEGTEVDFKRSVGALEPEDLVAFANSSTGGAVLLGVEERKRADGRQRGEVVGCLVGDVERLSILNKAESCIPPVEIEVIIENVESLPFFRVEIPSGPQKPYCTSGGAYKIRGDGANKPLTPRRLLALFMENEEQEFLERFGAATQQLDAQLERLLDISARLRTRRGPEEGQPGRGSSAPSMSPSVRRERMHADIRALHRKLDALMAHFGVHLNDDERRSP